MPQLRQKGERGIWLWCVQLNDRDRIICGREKGLGESGIGLQIGGLMIAFELCKVFSRAVIEMCNVCDPLIVKKLDDYEVGAAAAVRRLILMHMRNTQAVDDRGGRPEGGKPKGSQGG